MSSIMIIKRWCRSIEKEKKERKESVIILKVMCDDIVNWCEWCVCVVLILLFVKIQWYYY